VAWPTDCRPKRFGGLGVINLQFMGIALQMCWMWLNRVDPNRPGSGLLVEASHWSRALFEASVSVEINDGCSVLFWRDRWIDGESLETRAPNLCQTVPARICNSRIAHDALQGQRWVKDIRGGLSVQAILDYLHTWETEMEGRSPNDQPHVFRWKWSSNGQYSAASTYRAFFLGLTEQLGAKQLWKIKAPNKCRFFLWLLLHGRCWTSNRLQRHGLPNKWQLRPLRPRS
jgi:hypothetical protein